VTLHARAAHLQAGGRLPSLVLGVLRDASLSETAAVRSTIETSYRIGSITKTLTAVLVLQLRDEGRLSLGDPIGRFVSDTGHGAARIADLLGHTAGLPSEPSGPWWERSPGRSFAELALANDCSGAVAGPGEFFHYSNLGYGLLGELVARLRGGSWWEVVTERLLHPLGMDRTSYGPQRPHAQGYSVEHFTGRLCREPHTDTGAMAAAGQAWSTVTDLSIWAGVLAGRRPEVLTRESALEMSRDRLGAGYGLGLRLATCGQSTYVGHTGSMPGFLASLFVDPQRGDGVIALANATTGLDAEAMPRVLLHTALPDPLSDVQADSQADPLLGPPAEWEPTTTMPASLDGVVGLWFWGNTAIELRWENETLQARALQSGRLLYTFSLLAGRLVGVSGYHRGETLHVHATHLECATFVYTRVPYDPAAPIPG
ncbi:MAG: serine hydrolase domain-containing protein, partial [Nocardioides sp.]